MDTSLKVTFTELYEYASDFIWSTETKTRSKFDTLGVLRGKCVCYCLYWKVWLLVTSLHNPL